jgi:hypothetical protein
MSLKRIAAASATGLLAATLAAPATTWAQAPLPACAEHVIHMDDLPNDLTETVKYNFTVSSDDDNDVNVTMAAQGQAPFASGTIRWFSFGEPNAWIQADPGDPPVVVTATTTGTQSDSYEDCLDTVTRVLTHHAPQVSLLCSDYDGDGNYPHAERSPRTCTLGQQNWRIHADGFMGLGKINHWRGWGTNKATARATWYENMGLRAQVNLRLYRLRLAGDELIYTRAKVTHIRWNHKLHTRRSVTVKLPTHGA